MCGRTSLFVPLSVLEERFDARAVEPFEPRYNIAPSDDLAVIQDDAPGEIDLLRWGLLPHWVDDPDDWPYPINARAETVHEKPSFREAFRRRRCLVLADGYYEWQGHRGRKQPFRVCLEDDDPFALAGLWDRWEGDDEAVETVTVVTTDASEAVAHVHDRMPVMLAPEEEATWLEDDDPAVLRDLLDPYEGDDVRVYPISKAVNDPGNDSPAVVEPIGQL